MIYNASTFFIFNQSKLNHYKAKIKDTQRLSRGESGRRSSARFDVENIKMFSCVMICVARRGPAARALVSLHEIDSALGRGAVSGGRKA